MPWTRVMMTVIVMMMMVKASLIMTQESLNQETVDDQIAPCPGVLAVLTVVIEALRKVMIMMMMSHLKSTQ